MDEQQIRQIMIASVDMITDKLTNLELAVLNSVAQLGTSPHGRAFDYDKVKVLFTVGNGTRMHEETKLALSAIVNRRLG